MLTIRFNLCVEVESSCLTCYHIYIILGLGLLSLSWVCSSQKASKLKLNTIAFTSTYSMPGVEKIIFHILQFSEEIIVVGGDNVDLVGSDTFDLSTFVFVFIIGVQSEGSISRPRNVLSRLTPTSTGYCNTLAFCLQVRTTGNTSLTVSAAYAQHPSEYNEW
jgi:hypothetical protein